jgi:prefoldin subunit 5
MSEYQEEVLTNLLDLQAELRGDEPEPHDERPAEVSPEAYAKADTAGDGETIAVTEEGVTVSVSSGAPTDGGGVNERLAALSARLVQLEYELANVTKRIERMEPDAEDVSSRNTVAGVDERWHSFLDLQKIVADRLDQR